MGEEEEAASGSVAKEAFSAQQVWSFGFWNGGLGAAIVSSAGI